MQLAREAKTSDPLGRYYTESLIGQSLILAMGLSSPKTVLDLGAGSGALVQEASKIWTSSKFFTVDIDRRAESARFPHTHGPKFKHHVVDALDVSLANKLGLNWAQTDAAICNPPYLLPKWKRHFAEILEDARLSHAVPKTGDISADLLFIAQNLRMLKTGGKLGLILPDGIVAGEKYAPLRKALIAMHCIDKVIELPRRAFKNTDAKAHIIVLSKNGSSKEFIPVMRLDEDGGLSKVINAPSEDFSKRLDYSYLAGSKKYQGKSKIRDVAEVVARGSLSSNERKQIDHPVFHTTDFINSNDSVPEIFYLSKKQLLSFDGVVAKYGDILLARVGRNLSSKVCIVKKRGYVAISDCVLILRVKSSCRDEIFAFLKSQRGQQCIEAGAKGVGAKFITVNSLGEIRF